MKIHFLPLLSLVFVSSCSAVPRVAPSSAIAFDAKELKAGSVEVPSVSLSSDGNWSVFLVTKTVGGQYHSGTVLSIGTPSDTLFSDKGHLSISWSAQYPAAWRQGHFANTFVATAKDDAGTPAARRGVSDDQLFGVWGVSPLVGQANFDDGRAHGLALLCRKGRVEFWSVDEAGAHLMDYGDKNTGFKGISKKPLRIGGAQLVTQPAWPFTFWKQPVQSLVICSGVLSTVQMSRLFAGADARDVVDLQKARDDRYYPGTISAGHLDELVSGQVGTLSGAVSNAPSLLPVHNGQSNVIGDDVLVDMDGFGQVLPRAPFPATTSKARFWGTRVGRQTDIRMRVVAWDAPEPLPDAKPSVTPWTTVARNVADGKSWRGDVVGVPNGFADYDAEVSWKEADGSWSPAKRLHKRFSIGVVVGIGGQSIVQKMRDDGGSQRSFAPEVGGYIRAYYDINQGTAGYQDNRTQQGWQTRWTPSAPNTSRDGWGETRFAEKLALLTHSPVGIGNFAVGGSPIGSYLGDNDKWDRWKRFIQRERPQFGIWGNGQGDVGLSREARYAALDQLLAQYDDAVKTAPGGPWPYRFYVYPLNGDWGLGGNVDGIRSFDVEWARSRALQGKPVGVLCFTLDESTQDGTHLSDDDNGLGILASRAAQTLAHGMDAKIYSGLGPEVDRQKSAWHVAGGATIADLEVVPNGGTALVTANGKAPTGFEISIDGGPFAAPDKAVIVDATHIRLSSPVAAQKSVAVTYQAGAPGPRGDSNTTKAQAGTDGAVYDNRGDDISKLPGYPLAPIIGADPLVLRALNQK